MWKSFAVVLLLAVGWTSVANATCTGASGVPFNCTAGTAPGATDLFLGGNVTGADASLTVKWTGAQVAAGISPLLTTTVTNTYTASGAIATTDAYSLVACSSSPCVMTLANGTTAGHNITIHNSGTVAATITVATLDGATINVLLSAVQSGTQVGGTIALFWNATNSSYYPTN